MSQISKEQIAQKNAQFDLNQIEQRRSTLKSLVSSAASAYTIAKDELDAAKARLVIFEKEHPANGPQAQG